VLLLALPSNWFVLVVPWLIGMASLSILIRRNPARAATAPSHEPTWALGVGVFLVAIYGGYFGAAAGVLLVALLMLSTAEPLARNIALKNLLLGLANAVAALAFAVFGPVSLVGGGTPRHRVPRRRPARPLVVRRAPAGALRALIACAGLGLAVHLGLDAYGR